MNPSWTAAQGPYDLDLVEIIQPSTDTEDKVVVRLKTDTIAEVYTYSDVPMPNVNSWPDHEFCDLQDIDTQECQQVFHVYVESYTGIIADVGTVVVTIRKECFDIKVQYDKVDAAA